MKKVAVITRTKDRPNFLSRAIKSVSSQTVNDYVHVIVNDGGDKAVIDTVLNSFDKKIRQSIMVFHREKASGAPDTIFNESIDRVESVYIAIHDDDDTWHPEFLERTLPLLESGLMGVVVRADRVYENVSENEIRFIKSKHYMPDMSAVSLYRQCIDNQLTPIAFIYSRKAYHEIGGYDDELPVAGDWEFGIRFLSKYDVDYLDPGFPLAFYHQRKNVKDNSFTKHNHRRYLTQIINKYLRQDLQNGSLGIGYVMAKLRYDLDSRHKTIKKIVPSVIIKKLR